MTRRRASKELATGEVPDALIALLAQYLLFPTIWGCFCGSMDFIKADAVLLWSPQQQHSSPSRKSTGSLKGHWVTPIGTWVLKARCFSPASVLDVSLEGASEKKTSPLQCWAFTLQLHILGEDPQSPGGDANTPGSFMRPLWGPVPHPAAEKLPCCGLSPAILLLCYPLHPTSSLWSPQPLHVHTLRSLTFKEET